MMADTKAVLGSSGWELPWLKSFAVWRHRMTNEHERLAPKTDLSELFVVRLYDGMDNQWIDVSDPVSKAEADRIWLEKTANGTKYLTFDEIDYYKIFPADTKMLYSDGFGERR
jgi:hypothetical protein